MASGCCEECQKLHGFCPESARKLISHIPATKSELDEAVRYLKERGRILSNLVINDWDDLRQAMLPQKTEIGERNYPYSPPVVEVSSPPADAKARDAILKMAACEKEKNDAAVGEVINRREILPIAQFIGELLLKNGSGINIINKEVEKRYPDKEQVKAAVQFLKTSVDPILLMTRLAIYPILFPDCQKTRDFLRANSIKVANVFPMRACHDCRNKINGVCSVIGIKVIENGISDEEANQAIDEMHTVGRLSSAQVRDLKGIPDHKKRLAEAVGVAFTQGGERTNTKTSSECGSQNGLILSAENFANRQNAVLWAIDALSRTASVTQIRNELRKNRDDADRIVCDAMALLETVSADSLDACMDEKYLFASNPRLIRGKKCRTCPHADDMQCRRHGLVFSQVRMEDQDNGETREAKEVLDYFKDTTVVADVDPNSANKSIEIKFPNEGASMVVDLGPSNAITNYQQIYDLLPQDIDIGSKKGGLPPLEVEGLGAAEGLDLSGIF
jgi:hypothetical protein